MNLRAAFSLAGGFRTPKSGRRRGVSAIEYGILAALVAGVILAGVRETGVNLANLFGGFGTTVDSVVAPSGGSGSINFGAWTFSSWTVNSGGATPSATCTTPTPGITGLQNTNNLVLTQTNASLGINEIPGCTSTALSQAQYLDIEGAVGATSYVHIPNQSGSLTGPGSFTFKNSATQPAYTAVSASFASLDGYDWSIQTTSSDLSTIDAGYYACLAEGGTASSPSASGFTSMYCSNVPNYSFTQQESAALNTPEP